MKDQQIQSALRQGRFATNNSASPDPEPSLLDDSLQSNSPANRSPSSPSKHVTIPSQPPRTYGVPPLSPTSKKRKKTILSIKGYGRSGTIQSRTSSSSLLLQRWTTSHWLHVFPAEILIFDSEEKLKEWKAISDAENGESSEKDAMKAKLLQKSLNFDRQGNLQRKIDMYEQKGTSKTVPVATHQVVTTGTNYIMEDVRSKYYKRKGPLMHTCKISYFSHTGRNIVAAFGSSKPDELKKIRSISRYCIRLVRKASESSRKSPRYGDNTSTFSGMTHGAMSAVSGTHYGEMTMTKKAKKRWGRKRNRAILHDYANDAESVFSGASKSIGRDSIETDDNPRSPLSASSTHSWVRGN